VIARRRSATATGRGRLLVELCRRRGRAGAGWEVRGLRPEFRHITNLFNPVNSAPMRCMRPIAWPLAGGWWGRAFGRVAVDLRQQIGFVGELDARRVAIGDTASGPGCGGAIICG
jgi:hypothetical protein